MRIVGPNSIQRFPVTFVGGDGTWVIPMTTHALVLHPDTGVGDAFKVFSPTSVGLLASEI